MVGCAHKSPPPVFFLSWWEVKFVQTFFSELIEIILYVWLWTGLPPSKFFSCILILIYLKRIVNFSGAFHLCCYFQWTWHMARESYKRKSDKEDTPTWRMNREIFIFHLTFLILLIHFESCLSNFKYLRILKVYSTFSFLLLVLWPENAHFKFISFLEQSRMFYYFVKTTLLLGNNMYPVVTPCI